MNKTNLSSFDNSKYYPGANFIKRLLWYYVNILFFLVPLVPSSTIKIFFLRLFGAKIGRGVNIKPNVNIKYPWLLSIGDFSWIGEKVWIDNLSEVKIGNHVCLSQGSFLLCGNHNYKKKSFDLITGPITLEDGVWIGSHSIVCPGVICKSHSILSVGSIATKSLEPYSIYQGNPATKIRDRIIDREIDK